MLVTSLDVVGDRSMSLDDGFPDIGGSGDPKVTGKNSIRDHVTLSDTY